MNKTQHILPLSLYFIIDNKLISNQSEINSYFDILIE